VVRDALQLNDTEFDNGEAESLHGFELGFLHAARELLLLDQCLTETDGEVAQARTHSTVKVKVLGIVITFSQLDIPPT